MVIINDLKYACRLLFKRPGFTVLTVLVMAAGIGLSVYLFSFMYSATFKPLPFEDGRSLVQISASQNGIKSNGRLNQHDYYEIRTTVEGLSEFSAYKNVSLNVSGRDGARRYSAVLAEPNIFRLTRTEPVLGREFTPAEDNEGAERVVIIGYDIWQNVFGGLDDVVDETLRINGLTHRIVGVMPQGYYFPETAEMWLPLRQSATSTPRANAQDVYGLAHLDEGVSKEDVDRQLRVIMQRIEERYPKTNNGIGAYVDTLQMTNVGDGINVVYSMLVAAALILLLASINVGNLLLSRAIERGKETAIRTALGAPRIRLVGQMLWESTVICGIGGIIGLLLVAWGLGITETATANFFGERPSFWWKFGIDGFTLQIFLLFVVSTIVITCLLPAWRSTGADFNAVLRDGTRGTLGKKAGRLNRVLVMSEIFLSITVLIVAAVIVVGTFMETRADYGAETEDILTARVVLPESAYDSPEKQAQFARAIQAQLENSVGISDVMVSSALPGVPSVSPTMAIEGREYTQDRGFPRANYIVVTPGTLSKLGVELTSGRYFSNADNGLEKRTVIVTDSFVDRHFPAESPLGKRIRIAEADESQPTWLTIVGVVEHTSQGRANSNLGKIPSVFRPFSQAPRAQITIAMRTGPDQSEAVRTLRSTLQSIDPELPAFRIEPYEQYLSRLGAPLRFISTIFLLFGMAAVVLAASGIYGVMSNTVNQRTQEIGTKRALGAMEERITWEFLGAGGKQLLLGGLPGLLAGSAMGFAMSRILGIGSAAITVIAIAIVAVTAFVVMLATYLPTNKALRMEPSEALRYE